MCTTNGKEEGPTVGAGEPCGRWPSPDAGRFCPGVDALITAHLHCCGNSSNYQQFESVLGRAQAERGLRL